MPELIEQMYCSQQIVIPPKYPYILKRYCKCAIKTQPYDLLRWSFEYFKALAEHRPPPVKLRLEYPIYSTEGGLTRGCLKVLAQQLFGMSDIPMHILKQAWHGFCLDIMELKRILCLCEVYLRHDSVPYLHFLAVAGGMLTKCLTHTMILLCESLTKEPDGGSAAIPVHDFIVMYTFLAEMDASTDVKYHNGYREGEFPDLEEAEVEAEEIQTSDQERAEIDSDEEDDYWEGHELQRLALIDDHVARTARLSVKLTLPTIGKIERSPSIERASEIERDNYMRERAGRPAPSEEVEKRLQQLSSARLAQEMHISKEDQKPEAKEEKVAEKKETVEIFVFDEEETPVTYEIYGEPKEEEVPESEGVPETTTETEYTAVTETKPSEEMKEEGEEAVVANDADKLALFLAEVFQVREERAHDLEQTFEDIANIVDKYKTANYDLGMIAGRQMSTTSGEFIVQHIEKDIMAFIDEQIAILPDPDLKKKKAKPEEVAMVRDILEQFLEDNMDIIVPDIEEVEEEETPIPEITTVYAVPGIGGPVDPDIITDFTEYAREVSRIQGDMIMPRHIRHFLCPPLEIYVEHLYDIEEIKPMSSQDGVPTGGAITE